MFPNLNAELRRKGLQRKDLAVCFKDRIPSVSDKLNGKSKIHWEECVAIRNKFFPEHKLDYLFDESGEGYEATPK